MQVPRWLKIIVLVYALIGILFYYAIHFVEKRVVTWTATID